MFLGSSKTFTVSKKANHPYPSVNTDMRTIFKMAKKEPATVPSFARWAPTTATREAAKQPK